MPPAQVESLAEPLIAVYARAWERVLREMRALEQDPMQFRRRRRLEQMRQAIENEMNALEAPTREWLERRFPQTYGIGALSGAAAAGTPFAWGTIHRQAVQVMAGTLFDDLLGATKFVKQDTKRFIREIVRDEALQTALEGKTAVQGARLAASRLINEHGIASVVYRNGARHGLADYSEMALRTTTANAYNQGTLNGATGVFYFEIFDGFDCGLSFHDDPTKANGMIVDKATAQAFLIAHPRCQRSFGPRPDITNVREQALARPMTTAAQRRDQMRSELLRREKTARRAAVRRQRATRPRGPQGAAQSRTQRLRGRQDRVAGPERISAAVTATNRRVFPAPADFALRIPDQTLTNVTELRSALRETGMMAVPNDKKSYLKALQAVRFEKRKVYKAQVGDRLVFNVIDDATPTPVPVPRPVVAKPVATPRERKLTTRADDVTAPAGDTIAARVAKLKGDGISDEAHARAIGRLVEEEIEKRMPIKAVQQARAEVASIDGWKLKNMRDTLGGGVADVVDAKGNLVGEVRQMLNGVWRYRARGDHTGITAYRTADGALEALKRSSRTARLERIERVDPVAEYQASVRELERVGVARQAQFDELRDLDARLAAGDLEMVDPETGSRVAISARTTVIRRHITSGNVDLDGDVANYHRLQEKTMESARRVQDAYAAATREVLREIRPFGGKQAATYKPIRGTRAKNASRKLVKLLDEAAEEYPRDWLDLTESKVLRPRLKRKTDNSAHYGGHSALEEIVLRDNKATAVHELGHHMQYHVPRLADLEIAFRERRFFGWQMGDRYPGSQGIGIGDDLFTYYAGRVYPTDMGPSAGFTEVLTTAMEALLGDTSASAYRPEYQMGILADRDMLRFVLGLLAAL